MISRRRFTLGFSLSDTTSNTLREIYIRNSHFLVLPKPDNRVPPLRAICRIRVPIFCDFKNVWFKSRSVLDKMRKFYVNNKGQFTWSWCSSPCFCSISIPPSAANRGSLICTEARIDVPRLVGQKVRNPNRSSWEYLNSFSISSKARTSRPYTSPTWPP